VEVRLLGPVEVVDDDRVLEIPQRRQRALLALLAVHAGETVAIDRLVEELWGVEVPKTAVASLQNAVSQLRKLLGAETLVTREPGYALDGERVAVDVARFEHLLAEARAASAMQDEQTAGTVLREALALWRGPALADLAYEPFAQAEIRRLEELRQHALEERVDADLARGRHDELVPELETLVAREPLRERTRGQLMLALYRAGRQADALEAYRDARATLVEELGIEPGPELRQLQAAILRQDTELLLPGGQVATPRTPMQFRRLASILVADIVASSPGEEVDPETLHRILIRYYETVLGVVSAHGGAVERMAGDAVMAAFGVAVADESHALRAVRAAADLRAAVERLNAEADDATTLALRVGIATGEVLVAGRHGGGEPLATGQAIGVAAALEQAADVGEIVVGPLTQRLVRAAATTEPLGELALPHRSKPIAAFRVLEVSSEQPTFGSLLDTPLVGRKRELRALRALLRETRSSGSARAVCLLGPPGVGKSRIVREVVRGARGFDVHVARCPSYGRGITYWPLRQLVGDDEDAIRAAVDDARAADVLIRLDGPPAEIAWAFRSWCEARARERPLLLAVDDLHWAEPTFLGLLEHLVEHAEGPIATIGLSRDDLLDEQAGFLAALPNASRLVLDRLAPAETEVLVDELLGGAPLAPGVRARVFEVAEGNPLFVEQLVALAAEGDALGADQQLPVTIQALLAARLDRLGPGERAVLERAAVIGRDFTAEHVTALVDPVAVPTVERHVSSLTRRGFVEPRVRGGLRFRHVLLQEAAYRAAPKRLRSELHERLADRLAREGAAGDELVGFHLERAFRLRTELGPPDRAAAKLAEDAGRRLGDAGVRAWQRHDAPAALSLLERATALLPANDTRRLELLCELGSVLKWRMDDQRAVAVLEDVEAVAGEVRNDRLRLRAELELAWVRFVHGRTPADEILALTERAIPVLESAGDDRALGQAWLLAAAVHGSIRLQWGPCEDAALRSLEHYRRARFSTTAGHAMLAAAAKNGPLPVDDAIARCEEFMRSPASDRSSVAHLRIYVAHLEALRGNTVLAREHLSAAHEYVTGQGGAVSPDWAHAAASVELLDGDAGAAVALVEDACVPLEEVGERAWVSTLTSLRAEARYAQGVFPDALEASGKAMRLAPPDDLIAQVAWRRARAKASARMGELTDGERLAREAVDLLEGSDDLGVRADTLVDLSEVLHLAGKEKQGFASADDALELLGRKGITAGRDRAQRLARSPGGGLEAGEGRAGKTLPGAAD
jgi:DNA-binding SARP family transcriptional activator